MPDQDPMQVESALEKLNTALGLQHRSALEMTTIAGSLTGIEWHAVGDVLWSWAAEELADSRRLVEKIVALGGTPSTETPAFDHLADAAKALEVLVDHEREALAAIHAVIPDTGQEPRSEALEHRIEHIIMRKQEQVDTLHRLLGKADT